MGALTLVDATSGRQSAPAPPEGAGALMTLLASGSGALDRALDRSFRVDGDEVLAVLGRSDEVRESGDPVRRLRGGCGDLLRVAFRAREGLPRLGLTVP